MRTPAPELLDSYQLYRCATRQDLRDFWERYFAANFAGPGETLKVAGGSPLCAYVSWGRWVADCPMCRAGIAASPKDDQGACLECGLVYTIRTPPPADIAAATPLLLARPTNGPHRTKANWYPFPGVYGHVFAIKGETPDDLAAENGLFMGAAALVAG